MNNLAVSAALATAPSSAFAELRERPRFWFPLLLVILTTAGLTYWFYSVVDIDWLKETMFSNNPDLQALPEDKREAAMAMVQRGTMLWSSLIGICLAVPIVYLLEALYLLVAAKVTKIPLGFRHWFALACWTALPLLLGNVVAAILLLLADNAQISPSVLQPLSLNELLFHVPEGGQGYNLLASLGIPAFLSWVLAIIGVRTWSQRSWGFSATIVLLPWFVIYGLWAFFAFR